MQEVWGESLAERTTMRVGGPAARMVIAESTDELVDAVREVDDAEQPLLLMAGGSNLVISDDGFDGTVVVVANRGVRVESQDRGGSVCVRVAAGEPWDDVVIRACEQGWAGVEALSGIPGLAGATPVQNVGAYGQEVAQTIVQVRAYDRVDQTVRTIAGRDCAFGYRHSLFKGTDRYVVLDVLFRWHADPLSRPIGYAALADGLRVEIGDRVPLADARAAVLTQRARRGMVLDPADHDTWSCGSFFTNPILDPAQFEVLSARVSERLGPGTQPPRFPAEGDRVKTSAAWVIDRAGFSKGYGLPGPAALSTKHTLAITNRGGAKAADVLALARTVRDGVADTFGIRLVNEPVLVGESL